MAKMKIDEIPVSWWGLTDAQTLAVLPFVVDRKPASVAGAVRILLDKRTVRAMTDEDIYDLTRNGGDLAFLWDEDIEGPPFVFFESQGVRFYLPAMGFGNVILQEFLNANTYFLQFADLLSTARKDPKALQPNGDELMQTAKKLIAHTCRPANETSPDSLLWNGDSRQPYNEHVAEARAKNLEIDLHTAVAIVRYWGNETSAFYDRNDILEDAPDDDAPDDEAQDAPTWYEMALVWKQAHFDLAQDRALGDFKTISTTTMPDIGMYLAKLKTQGKERERLERRSDALAES